MPQPNIYTMKKTLLALLMLFSLYSSAFIEDTLKIQPNVDRYMELERITEYYLDVDRSASINKLLSNDTEVMFVGTNNQIVNSGYSKAAHWLRFTVKNNDVKHKEFALQLDNASLNEVTLYLVKNNSVVVHTSKSGVYVEQYKKEIQGNQIAFPIELNPGEVYDVYLRVTSNSFVSVPISMIDRGKYESNLLNIRFALGTFYGILLVIFIYNLLMYFSFNDRSYLYYVLYVFTFGVATTAIDGFAGEYFNFLVKITDARLDVYAALLAMMSSLLFTRRFLNIKKISKGLDFSIMFTLAVGAILFVSNALQPSWFQAVLAFTAVFYLLVIITSGFLGFEHGMRSAKFFLISHSFLLVAAVIYMLTLLDVISPSFLTLHSLHIGSALEFITLTFGIADKINSLRDENEKALNDKLQSSEKVFELNKKLEETNLILEEKVRERTEEIVKQSRELEAKNVELKELNEDKNHFIGILAHDIRSPLTGIQGFAQLLKSSRDKLSPDQLDYVNTILQCNKQISDMVNQILDLNAIEARKIKMNTQRIDLAEVLIKLIGKYKDEAGRKDISFSPLAGDATDTYADVDPNYINQILENLISNAVKYSPKNKRIFANIFDKGDKVMIEVKDEGPGISKEDQQKLFGKFQKLTAKPTGGEDSTGLGLSIVKKYVEAMNGRVWCESEEGKGSSFFIEFPKAA